MNLQYTGSPNNPQPYKYTHQIKAPTSCTPEIPEFHPNLMNKATTPLQFAVWSATLRSHPDTEFAGYLLEGIHQGFCIGYNYHTQPCGSAKDNLPSAREHPQTISISPRRLQKVESQDHSQFLLSQTSKLTKQESSPRNPCLENGTDLSFPHGKSVNDGIDPDITTLTYIRVNDIAQKVATLGKGTNMAKVDIEEAYRLMPIHSDDKHLLGMHREGQV